MSIETVAFTAGQRLVVNEVGRFFRVLEADDPVNVTFYLGGKEVARAELVKAGYAETYNDGGFDSLAITSPTAQVVQYAVRLQSTVDYDKAPVGDTQVLNVVGVSPSQTLTGTQTAENVTSASTSILSALAGRTYLFIQNKHATGTIWINLMGIAATQANGIRLEPGEFFEMAGNRVTAAAITAIGDIASNTDVVAVELQ